MQRLMNNGQEDINDLITIIQGIAVLSTGKYT